MKRCIQLAKNGLGTTYPNPLVGSVIVHNNRIIGEGWHRASGEPHAEVNAIESVSQPELLKESIIYVNLEPCSHTGKTPPCASLIIQKGIPTVIVGSTDPNPKVSGNGIKALREAGCEVTTGILEEECDDLNKRFFTFQEKKRPYIFLKWAETADGFIAPEHRTKKEPVWITDKRSRQWVHKLRAQEESILVGTKTALVDDPSLTTRDWHGSSPLRVIIDRNRKIPMEAKVFDPSASTLLLSEKLDPPIENITFLHLDFTRPVPPQICQLLFEMEIQSLIVEGGAHTLQAFIDINLWDEAYVFVGNTTFEAGVKAPGIAEINRSKITIGADTLTHYKNTTP